MAYSAFTPFSRTERAEAQPLVQPGPFNLTVQATANIRAWCRPKATQGDAALDKQSEYFYLPKQPSLKETRETAELYLDAVLQLEAALCWQKLAGRRAQAR